MCKCWHQLEGAAMIYSVLKIDCNASQALCTAETQVQCHQADPLDAVNMRCSMADSWALDSKHVEQSLSQIRCDDSNAKCAEWVKMGECAKNAAWMVSLFFDPYGLLKPAGLRFLIFADELVLAV